MFVQCLFKCIFKCIFWDPEPMRACLKLHFPTAWKSGVKSWNKPFRGDMRRAPSCLGWEVSAWNLKSWCQVYILFPVFVHLWISRLHVIETHVLFQNHHPLHSGIVSGPQLIEIESTGNLSSVLISAVPICRTFPIGVISCLLASHPQLTDHCS